MVKSDWLNLTKAEQVAIEYYFRQGYRRKEAWQHAAELYPDDPSLTKSANTFWNRKHIRDAVENIRVNADQIANRQLATITQDFAARQIENGFRETSIAISSAWVLRRAALLADFNINRFLVTDEHGNAYFDFSAATDDDWYCIQEYTVTQITGHGRIPADKIKLKAVDKLRALELVGRHIEVQAFKEIHELQGKVGVSSLSEEELSKKLLELGVKI